MYEVDELERLIREELDECISFDDYANIDDFGDALIDYEDCNELTEEYVKHLQK